jgi:hypothetical protein
MSVGACGITADQSGARIGYAIGVSWLVEDEAPRPTTIVPAAGRSAAERPPERQEYSCRRVCLEFTVYAHAHSFRLSRYVEANSASGGFAVRIGQAHPPHCFRTSTSLLSSPSLADVQQCTHRTLSRRDSLGLARGAASDDRYYTLYGAYTARTTLSVWPPPSLRRYCRAVVGVRQPPRKRSTRWMVLSCVQTRGAQCAREREMRE